MKKTYKILVFVIFTLALLLMSCRNEELELVQPDTEEVLAANSTAATLIERTSMKDGSNDNIIDRASCFEVQLPVTVIVNGIEFTVNTEDDFDEIEAIFDELEDDEDTLEIIFPIIVILNDFTEETINSIDEFERLSMECGDEGEEDDDIECVDFKYPFRISVFNPNNEVIETVVIESDRQLYRFVKRIEENDIVRVQFPITLILADGTELVINSLRALEEAIESAIDDCDEDDDYDYNDDDCDDCSTDRLTEILTGCEKWEVDKLIRNNTDQAEQYIGYYFSFSADGSVTVFTNGDPLASGTWESSGERNNISFVLNIPDFVDFNDTWRLHEVEQENGEKEVDLRKGDDRLRFESGCNNDNSGNESLATILTVGAWEVAQYTDSGVNETADYDGYEIVFNENGSVIASRDQSPIEGGWNIGDGGNKLFLNFNEVPFDEFTDDWDVISVTETRIELKDISGGDGSIDILVFEKL
ncbi:hypothetical protein [Ascidiimonas sp. W6]|uniref:hypothetical protein n=1 Tax=Ascidiimonas meishanensis TaxID=3128903 RepID=UPI0030EC32F3